MAESNKLDLSSLSPDRPLPGSGPRGSHQSVSLDRSGSFREGTDVSMSSIPSTVSRGNYSVTQGDVENFFESLRLDIKSVAADQKLQRGELKRYLSSATGISLDDSLSSSKTKALLMPSPEELKKIKFGLRENSNKARERGKVFGEALSTFGNFFPNIPSKRRSRVDVPAGDRSITPLSSYRSTLATAGKVGSQNTFASNFLEQKKSVERIKNSIPSRRTRTSLLGVDARACFPARQTGAIDREGESVKLAGVRTVQVEDRTLSISTEGWEKSKMKKKRSAIKADAQAGASSPKSSEGYREPRQSFQQRLVIDARQKTSESRTYRPGVANASGGIAKFDGTSQQACSTVRGLIPRAEHDTSSLLNDRMARPTSIDTERINIRTNMRDDLSSSGATNVKANACVRAPRSSSLAPKLSPVARGGPNDWEILQCGGNNRKRMLSTRCPSPSVAQWAGQRPQKISRIARRTNFVPIVSSNDDTHTSDSISDIGNDNALGSSARHLPIHSPQQIKSMSDHFSSAAPSESEESGCAELKSRDKAMMHVEMDEKDEQTDKKGSTLVLPSRKNKLLNGDSIGDGVRRQGRSGRGFPSARPLVPLTGNTETTQQLINARPGLEKNERMRRPPTRKPSDRKPYARQKHSMISMTADFLDDGREELLAAANAAITPSPGSSEFWRQREMFFRFILNSDICYLKQQLSVRSNGSFVVHGAGNCSILSLCNDFEPIQCKKNIILDGNNQMNLEQSKDTDASPLFEKLLQSLISVEDCEGIEDTVSDVCDPECDLDTEWDCDSLYCQMLEGFVGDCNTSGVSMMTNGDSFGVITSRRNGYITDQESMTSGRDSKVQYSNLSLDERILLELQSIGIFPCVTSDNGLMEEDDEEEEEITASIRELEGKYLEQVSRNKDLLIGLLKSASEGIEDQEKEFESRAMDKLVIMAHEKYMSCWGPNASGGKSANSKMARQAALAFVRRTMERCHKFEETGKSCFSEPMFRDMLRSGSLEMLQFVDSSGNGGSSKLFKSITPSAEISNSVSLSSQISPLTCQKSENHDVDSSDAIRVKKKELLLDDVGSAAAAASEIPPVYVNSFSGTARGKRSERDREGNAQNRDGESRTGNRRSKAKPPLPEISEHPDGKEELVVLDDPESIDLINFDIPMDDLTDLVLDDEAMQDHDFMSGLEIPMDDLSDVNMMV